MSFSETARTLSGQMALLLAWRPDDFWGATPDELAAILAAFAPVEKAADGTTLSELMTRFPDTALEMDNG